LQWLTLDLASDVEQRMELTLRCDFCDYQYINPIV
jgi:hypothetical protein